MHLVDIRPKGVVNSASQTERYDRCQMRWALEKLFGVQTPQHPSAQLGTEVHSILEHWLKSATPPDKKTKQGHIASRMIKHLPPPGTGVTERKFYFVTDAGIAFTGYIDWSGIWDSGSGHWPTVIDHKTTGNLEYAKTELDLPNDVQALTYTVAGCLGFQVEHMQLLWNYGSTKKVQGEYETKPVRARTYLPIVTKQFSEVIDPLCAEIVWHTENPADHPSRYLRNPNACDDYGGCPHQKLGLCEFTQEERIRAAMNQPPTLAARLAGPQFAPPGNGAGGFAPPTVGFAPQGAPEQRLIPAFAPSAPVGMNFGASPHVAVPGGPGSGNTVGGSFAPPGSPMPGGFTPPTAPPQYQQPPQPQPGQQQLPYSPEMAPNPPESGMAAPQVAQGANGAPKRGRGRPKKETAQEGAQAPANAVQTSAQSALIGEQEVYLRGMLAFMAHPKWDGSPEQLHWAGSMAVNTVRLAFQQEPG